MKLSQFRTLAARKIHYEMLHKHCITIGTSAIIQNTYIEWNKEAPVYYDKLKEKINQKGPSKLNFFALHGWINHSTL